mgnify:FL=1|tara:strand:+ start:74 stop:1435 length:1362 start_codon:yes stop_codon:yes gene_type:complete
MALTLQQYPTSPNIANSNLVYLCTSTQVAQPQFQFVVDIKDESGTLIQRVKQQPNPSSKGVFDIGNIMPTELGPTDKVWDISAAAANVFCARDFEIAFGEEYGTSVSSSVTLYDGAGSPGDPAVTQPTAIFFLLDGVTNPEDLIDWNWNSGSKYDEEDPLDDVTFNHQFGLTTFNSSSIRLGDYHTISLLNGNTQGNGDNPNSAMDVFAATIRQYDSSGVIGSTDIIYNEVLRGGSPTVVFWNDVYTLQTDNTRLIHWPAGPQNLVDAGIGIDSDLAYYTITFTAQATDGLENSSGVWGTYRFDVTTANCGYEGVRFAYKNIYGVWDYFNFGLAESNESSIERQQYKQSFLNYSNTDNNVAYDKERRGKNNYYNKITNQRTANSDYLTQTDADNLRELFNSTDVYAADGRYGGQFLPVIITNASITEKTNPRTQKLFKYTVEYQFANEARSRR